MNEKRPASDRCTPGTAAQGGYRPGTLLRYAASPTALFRVSHAVDLTGNGRYRYFGEHCMGGLYSAAHDLVWTAGCLDEEIWEQHLQWRIGVESDFGESSGWSIEG